MKWLFETNDSLAAPALRVMLGVVMFPHGAQKVLGWFGGSGPSATIANFMHHFHLPPAVAVLVMIAEFLGAIGLIMGFLTRLGAFGILCDMIGAIAIVHWRYGFFMNWFGKKAGEGFEYHLLVIAMCIALLILGGGRWSIDRWMSRKI